MDCGARLPVTAYAEGPGPNTTAPATPDATSTKAVAKCNGRWRVACRYTVAEGRTATFDCSRDEAILEDTTLPFRVATRSRVSARLFARRTWLIASVNVLRATHGDPIFGLTPSFTWAPRATRPRRNARQDSQLAALVQVKSW